MRVVRSVLGGMLVAGMLTGCVSGRVSRPVESGGHYLITQSELENIAANSMYDAVLKLRPHFLRNRTVAAHGKAETRQLMLYVNGEKMESVDDLRRLSPGEVMEVRFYEPQQAKSAQGRNPARIAPSA